LRFADSDSSNWVALQAPATVASNVTWTLPATDGTSNQALVTNGSGTLSWATAGGGASISAGDSKVEVTDTGSNGTIVFNTDNAERMRVNASGNVGIGVTPSAWSAGTALQVKRASFYTYDNSGVEISQNAAVISGAWQRIGADFATKYGQDTGNHYWYTAASSTAGSAITWSERARITNGGYFKASSDGTYDGISGTYHEFNGDATSDPTLFVYNKNASYAGKVVDAYCIRNTTNASYYFFRGRVAGVADRFLVADSGNVTNTNGTYGTISDQKLKQDIVDASSQWNDIKNLRFRKYRLKADVELNPDAKPFLGLIAQEAEIVSPGLVEEQTDRDEEGNDLGTTTKSVKTSILYMKAVKALQEAMERIETLEAQNAAFEARLAALEAN
jgi:hypothetical protein